MAISIFDLFSIGIGPSSSHTVGPMRAAQRFASSMADKEVKRILVEVYGSLALTGKGHGTDKAILNGLEGALPHTCIPESLQPRMLEIILNKKLSFNNHEIHFDNVNDFLFHQHALLPKHSNGMCFTAWDSHDLKISEQVYYSVGGGFIVSDAEFGIDNSDVTLPFPFNTADELLAHARQQQLSIREIMLANEKCWRSDEVIRDSLLNIAAIMHDCIHAGCHASGVLPGFLKVKRRAPELFKKLTAAMPIPDKHSDVMHWLNIYAMAVNEENAAGGRIVTAPTNGAAGIIPSVLHYYKNFHPTANDEGIITFLLTAGAIAILYKKGASISGAEVGCQGEVGVASSMAAAALTAVLGGTLGQIEKAAEIAMEHHLGMTCDPIGGLVQIPCIERNAMGAVKAVNAARIALMEDEAGEHKISLDKVIATMRQTGKDMMTIYKETALGGLAATIKDPHSGVTANIPEC
jgi:L-serine dehydratase